MSEPHLSERASEVVWECGGGKGVWQQGGCDVAERVSGRPGFFFMLQPFSLTCRHGITRPYLPFLLPGRFITHFPVP